MIELECNMLYRPKVLFVKVPTATARASEASAYTLYLSIYKSQTLYVLIHSVFGLYICITFFMPWLFTESCFIVPGVQTTKQNCILQELKKKTGVNLFTNG